MGFGIFVGFVATIIMTSNITTSTIKNEIRNLYHTENRKDEEIERLKCEIRSLKQYNKESLEMMKERTEARVRAEADQMLFKGGVVAALLTGAAVVGPAVVEAMKQLR